MTATTWTITANDGRETSLLDPGPWHVDGTGRLTLDEASATFHRDGSHLLLAPHDSARLLRGEAPARWLHAPTRLVDGDRVQLGESQHVLRIGLADRTSPAPPPRASAPAAHATGRALLRQVVLQTGALTRLGRARGLAAALRGGAARPALWIAALVAAALAGRCSAGPGIDPSRLARAEARAAGCPTHDQPASWPLLVTSIVDDDVALILRGEVLRAFVDHLPRGLAAARAPDHRLGAALEASGLDPATARLLSIPTATALDADVPFSVRTDPDGPSVCLRGPLSLSGTQARQLGLHPTDDALVDASTIATWSRLPTEARREAVLAAWTATSQRPPDALVRPPRQIILRAGIDSCIVRDQPDERDAIGRVAVAVATALRHHALPPGDTPGAAAARIAALHLLHDGPLQASEVHDQLASSTAATRGAVGRHLATIAASSCLSPTDATIDACDILRGRVSRGMPP